MGPGLREDDGWHGGSSGGPHTARRRVEPRAACFFCVPRDNLKCKAGIGRVVCMPSTAAAAAAAVAAAGPSTLSQSQPSENKYNCFTAEESGRRARRQLGER